MMWQSGDIIGDRYRIEKLVGTGGMAHVYRAIDLKARRLVALKVLKEEFAQNGEFVRRFKFEAETVLQLNHDNIVKSYDIAEEDGTHYIVLEYIEGRTLKQLIRSEGLLPPSQAITFAIQICDALSHAHDRLLIHRDVKPQNIIITPKGRAKITDFGIVRFADANTVTYAGTNILGSVHYISPEQARGEQVDASSDLYSVGIVIYEMLTGKLPFNSDSTVSVAIKHIQEPIVPPIECRDSIGRALNDIVLKATQKDKTKRYQSARELKRDLQRALREPDADFASVEEDQEASTKKSFGFARTRFGGILNIAVATCILLGLLLSVFLIVRTVFSGSSDSAVIVPQLVNKTEQEALERCEELGVNLVVAAKESDKSTAAGRVFHQSPQPGTEIQEGDNISVRVSTGPEELVTPMLVNLPWEEARGILQGMNIQYETHYEISDQIDGTVLKQIPVEGTVLQWGDSMEVWIAGQPSEDERLPSLISMKLDEAVQLLQSTGFERVIVTYIDSEDGVSGTVSNQLPASGNFVPRSEAVKLWVCRPLNTAYIARDALNINVDIQDSKIMVTAKEGIVETVLFEETRPAGKQAIPVTIESDQPGKRTLLVYVNGVLVREKEVELENKNRAELEDNE